RAASPAFAPNPSIFARFRTTDDLGRKDETRFVRLSCIARSARQFLLWQLRESRGLLGVAAKTHQQNRRVMQSNGDRPDLPDMQSRVCWLTPGPPRRHLRLPALRPLFSL